MTSYSILADAVVSYREALFCVEIAEFPGMEELQRTLAIAEQPTIVPPRIPVLLDKSGPRLDYMGTENFASVHICSQRFIDILANYSAPGITLPVYLLDSVTSEPIHEQAYMWRPIRLRDAVDWDQSELVVNRLLSQREIWGIALTDACIQANLPIFEADRQFEYLVRDDVRASMEAAEISGVDFYPLTMPRERRLFTALGDPSDLRPYKPKHKR